MANSNPRGRASALIGVALVGLGAMFLLAQVFRINLWNFFWPFFIIIPGLLFFVGMVLGGKPAGPLAIPGSIVTMVGLILLYCAITGHWDSWAYAWALIFPTAVGVGLVINGAWSEVDSLVNTGMKWITTGFAIFLFGGLFFELLIFSRGGVGKIVWPLVLIGLGGYLLIRHNRGQAVEVSASATPPVVEAPPQPPAPSTVQAAPRRTRRSTPKTPVTDFEPLDMNRGKKKEQ